MAHLKLNENEIDGIYQSFSELVAYFDTMQAADGDKTAFPAGLSSVTAAMAGASGNYQTVNSGFYRPLSYTVPDDMGSSNSNEKLLDKAPERDGNFIVIPNVLYLQALQNFWA